MKEVFDLIDEHGIPNGLTKERSAVHRDGDYHRTSHVWIYRKTKKGCDLLLQKRSDIKDSFPGCYDISSAGHIPAGDEYLESAIRELQEELGLAIKPKDLTLCFYHEGYSESIFHGEPFRNHEYSAVFLYDGTALCDNMFTLQKEEISEVRWMDYREICEGAGEQRFPNCIFMDEVEDLAPYLPLTEANKPNLRGENLCTNG